MKTIKVKNSDIVLVLTKVEASALNRCVLSSIRVGFSSAALIRAVDKLDEQVYSRPPVKK